MRLPILRFFRVQRSHSFRVGWVGVGGCGWMGGWVGGGLGWLGLALKGFHDFLGPCFQGPLGPHIDSLTAVEVAGSTAQN